MRFFLARLLARLRARRPAGAPTPPEAAERALIVLAAEEPTAPERWFFAIRYADTWERVGFGESTYPTKAEAESEGEAAARKMLGYEATAAG